MIGSGFVISNSSSLCNVRETEGSRPRRVAMIGFIIYLKEMDKNDVSSANLSISMNFKKT